MFYPVSVFVLFIHVFVQLYIYLCIYLFICLCSFLFCHKAFCHLGVLPVRVLLCRYFCHLSTHFRASIMNRQCPTNRLFLILPYDLRLLGRHTAGPFPWDWESIVIEFESQYQMGMSQDIVSIYFHIVFLFSISFFLFSFFFFLFPFFLFSFFSFSFFSFSFFFFLFFFPLFFSF